MTDIVDIIAPDRVACGAEAGSKKRALELLSERLASAAPNLTTEEIFEALLARERLGSTGMGEGVALPHGRLDGIDQPIAACITLRDPVDFDALDNRPVDLLFALLVPEAATEEHLQLLAQLAQMFGNPEFRAELRACHDSADLMEVIRRGQPQRVSA